MHRSHARRRRVGPQHRQAVDGPPTPALRQRRPAKSDQIRSRRRQRDSAPVSYTIQVVVCTGMGQRFGLVVDRILDIVEETLVSRSVAHRRGVLFTAVIQGRVTEFLDIESIFGSVDPDVREPQQPMTVEV